MNIRLEEVIDFELYQGFDARLLCVGTRLPNKIRLDINSDSMGAILLGRRNHDAAIPAAEIVNGIAAFDLRHFEHGAHHLFRAGHEGRIDLDLRNWSLASRQASRYENAGQDFDRACITPIIAPPGAWHPFHYPGSSNP